MSSEVIRRVRRRKRCGERVPIRAHAAAAALLSYLSTSTKCRPRASMVAAVLEPHARGPIMLMPDVVRSLRRGWARALGESLPQPFQGRLQPPSTWCSGSVAVGPAARAGARRAAACPVVRGHVVVAAVAAAEAAEISIAIGLHHQMLLLL